MATLKQKRAVKKILENPRLPLGEVMRQSGYSPQTALNPQDLTESKGFKQALAENGLTEAFITTALVSDIKAKPRKRFFELSLGAEILGMKKKLETNTPSVVILNISSEVVKKYESDPTPIKGNK